MFCPSCGKELEEGSLFCSYCGGRVEENEEPPASPKSSVPPVPPGRKMKKPPYTIIAGAVAAVAILVVALFVFPGFLKKDAGNGNGAAIEEDGDVVSMGGDGLLNLTGADAESLVDPEKQDAEKDKGKDAGEAAKEEAVSDNNEKIEVASVEDPSSGEPVPAQDPGLAADAAAQQHADMLSTDHNAAAMEFEWFDDIRYNADWDSTKPYLNAPSITNPNYLAGGWKCMMKGIEGVYSSDIQRYLNAEFETDGGSLMKITLNWSMIFDPSDGSSIEETGSDDFIGDWNRENGSAKLDSSFGLITLDRFFELNNRQYGIGSFEWISGEKDYILFMRP